MNEFELQLEYHLLEFCIKTFYEKVLKWTSNKIEIKFDNWRKQLDSFNVNSNIEVQYEYFIDSYIDAISNSKQLRYFALNIYFDNYHLYIADKELLSAISQLPDKPKTVKFYIKNHKQW